MPNFEGVRFNAGRPLLKEITADKFNLILSEIRRNKPKGERGISVRQSGDGTYIGLASKPRTTSAAVEQNPWDIYIDASEGEGDEVSYTLKVRPGTLAGILPQNWEDEFEANGDDLFYGIAKVTTDGTYITGVTIDISDEEPEVQEATEWGLPENVDVLFGLFKEGQSWNVTGGQNIDVYGKNVIITTNPEAQDVGDPAYSLWFKLQ